MPAFLNRPDAVHRPDGHGRCTCGAPQMYFAPDDDGYRGMGCSRYGVYPLARADQRTLHGDYQFDADIEAVRS